MKNIISAVLLSFYLSILISGPGIAPVFFGISLRKIIFIISTILLSFTFLIFKRVRYSTYDKRIFILILIYITIWSIIIPGFYDTSYVYVFGDAGALLLLFWYFPIILLIENKMISWEKFELFCSNSVILLAIVHIVLWSFQFIIPPSEIRFLAISFFTWGGGSDLDLTSIYVGLMSSGFFRVFWISSVLMIPVFFIILYKWKNSIYKKISLIIMLLAILITYTRGIWIGIVIGLGLGILYTNEKNKKIYKIIVLLMIGLFFAFMPHNTILERVMDLEDLSNDDNIRLIQTSSHFDTFYQYPLLGIGFGGSASYIRSIAAPYSYEMTLSTTIMKSGVLGTLILLLFLYLCYKKALTELNHTEKTVWISGFSAFLFASMTNPYLFNFVGMSIVLFYMVRLNYYSKTNKRVQFHE